LSTSTKKCEEHSKNAVAKAIICMCRCCFWCLESFLKFISSNAYIMMAIHGKNFFSSASDAFKLLSSNIIRVVVIDQVADFLLFLGKVVVTAFMGLLSYYVFSNRIGFIDAPSVNYYWVPILVICTSTYFIAASFFNVYDMAVDTIFLCFLEDSEINDGSSDRPYYMSSELREILHKKRPDSAKSEN